MIDLSIKKDPRSQGKTHHKMPYGTSSPAAKKQALADISKENGNNYVVRENEVMRLSKIPKFVIT